MGMRDLFSGLAEIRPLARCLGTLKGARGIPRRMLELVSWSATTSRYHLWAAPTGITVFRFDAAPPHYACPKCYERRLISRLQADAERCLYVCPLCGCDYLLKERPKPPPLDYGPGGFIEPGR